MFAYVVCVGQANNPFDIPTRGQKKDIVIVQDPIVSDRIDTTTNHSINENKSHTEGLISTPTKLNNNPFEVPDKRISSSEANIETKSQTEVTGIGLKRPVDMKLIVLVYSLVMMIILTLAISMDRKRFGSIANSSINSNYLKTLYRDTKAWSNPQFIVLYIFFIMNMAFATWLIIGKIETSLITNLFIIIGAVLICYAVRHIVMWIISAVYPVGKEVGQHNYSIAIHNIMLGVFLLPVILIVEFVPGMNAMTLGYIAIFFIVLFYILRQLKGILSCVGMRGFNPFYFFIYLCAVEIAPILVGYKMMIGAL